MNPAKPRPEELSTVQLAAVDLLAAGKNDTAVAAALGVNRCTVSRWRSFDVGFRASLNRRRQEIWAESGDRLRSLLPRALDTLAELLGSEEPTERHQAAVAILRIAGPFSVAPTGPLTAGDVLLEEVEQERSRLPASGDVFKAMIDGRPSHEELVAMVSQRLAMLAAARDSG